MLQWLCVAAFAPDHEESQEGAEQGGMGDVGGEADLRPDLGPLILGILPQNKAEPRCDAPRHPSPGGASHLPFAPASSLPFGADSCGGKSLQSHQLMHPWAFLFFHLVVHPGVGFQLPPLWTWQQGLQLLCRGQGIRQERRGPGSMALLLLELCLWWWLLLLWLARHGSSWHSSPAAVAALIPDPQPTSRQGPWCRLQQAACCLC
mmetsp:Transcript_14130/g.34853  ORF Transcript_14130/g.34853 Transcript_14130/m.34853 type:complete len:205 (+) Transcript_14130:1945-2559(+)